MATKTEKWSLPDVLTKGKVLPAIVSLVIGLVLGTSFGEDLLGAAGIPKSCVQAIQRADHALDTGAALADNGKAAFAAARDLEVSDALELLRDARDQAEELLGEIPRFSEAKTTCDKERK